MADRAPSDRGSGMGALRAIRESSVIRPSSSPVGETTGTPLIAFSRMVCATSRMPVSGVTVIAGLLIISRTSMLLSFLVQSGLDGKLAVPIEQFPVDQDLAVLAHVTDEVPMHRGLVAAPRFRIARANRHMQRAADLLVV